MSAPHVVYRMATGGLVWALPGSSMQIMWAGPGSRLRIGQVLKAGGATTFIDHPTADGSYRTKTEATAAVKRFIAAGDPIQQRLNLGSRTRTRSRGR